VFLHVSAVEVLDAARLRVVFTNGVSREVDLSAELHGEVVEPLRDPAVFRQVQVNEDIGTIEWPNGADFAPEYLIEIGRDVSAAGDY
jgi:hypothetical protein